MTHVQLPAPRLDGRDRETFDRSMGVIRAAEHELIVKHGVPVEAAIRLVQEVHQAAFDRGWYLASPIAGTKENRS
jgi:hypothetical protein